MGKWAGVGEKGCLQVGPVPGRPGAAYLLYDTRLALYDAQTGQGRTVVDFQSRSQALSYYSEYYTEPVRFRAMVPLGQALLLSSINGLYRYTPNAFPHRLPLPILRNETVSTSPRGDVYIWNADTLIHLPR